MKEPIIDVLVLAFIASFGLTVLMAAASHARAGLRGRHLFIWTGFGIGLLAGAVELLVAIQLVPIGRLVEALGRSVWFEVGVEATITAFTYFFIVGLALQAGLFFLRRRARRRGDVVALAAGLGCGVALSASLLRLAFTGIWPPSVLFVAVVYPPLQLGFVLLLAAAVLAARDRRGSSTLAWQATAVVVQGGYQFVLRINDTVGHWLAWLEPGQIGALWLGLIVLAWAMGLAVMQGLARAEPEPAYREADPATGMLRARLWVWLAGLVLLPTAIVLVASFYVEPDARTAGIMILALLATPLMAGAILLRTAFTLKRKPGDAVP